MMLSHTPVKLCDIQHVCIHWLVAESSLADSVVCDRKSIYMLDLLFLGRMRTPAGS